MLNYYVGCFFLIKRSFGAGNFFVTFCSNISIYI